MCERLLIEKISALGLCQANTIVNSRNTVLDLVLTNFSCDFGIYAVSQDDLLDENSVHHVALSIRIALLDRVCDDMKKGFIKSIKYKKSRMDVIQWSRLTNDTLLNDLTLSFDGFREILCNHTTEEYYNYHESQSRHPWTRDRSYRELYNKVRAHRRRMDRANIEQIAFYNDLTASLRSKYDTLKTKYYSGIVSSGYRQPNHFYRFVKSLRNPHGSLPSTMFLDVRNFTGQRRFEFLAIYVKKTKKSIKKHKSHISPFLWFLCLSIRQKITNNI